MPNLAASRETRLSGATLFKLDDQRMLDEPLTIRSSKLRAHSHTGQHRPISKDVDCVYFSMSVHLYNTYVHYEYQGHRVKVKSRSRQQNCSWVVCVRWKDIHVNSSVGSYVNYNGVERWHMSYLITLQPLWPHLITDDGLQ